MTRIFLFWFFFLTVAGNAAERYHLTRIVITGSNRYSQEDIVRASGLRVNSQVSLDDLAQGARWNRARMRLTTSAAELASRVMRSAVIFARSTFGGAEDSQR